MSHRPPSPPPPPPPRPSSPSFYSQDFDVDVDLESGSGPFHAIDLGPPPAAHIPLHPQTHDAAAQRPRPQHDRSQGPRRGQKRYGAYTVREWKVCGALLAAILVVAVGVVVVVGATAGRQGRSGE